MRRRATLVLVVVTGMFVGSAFIARPYLHGAAFVVRAADMHGFAREVADLDTHALTEQIMTIDTPNGPLRGRMYLPARSVHRTVLLTSGLHPSGIDEPRLLRLARNLASAGLAVFTPDIPDLSEFSITPAITDAIESAAGWLFEHGPGPRGARIGLMGISFSGGLSIVAAGRPSLANRVEYVFAFGGHDDLPRVLRYLCTGQEPYPPQQIRLKASAAGESGGPIAIRAESSAGDTFARVPHDYGVAVILLGVAERVVPPRQVAPLRAAVRRYLLASALDTNVDKARASEEFDALKETAKRLPEPSATLLRYVNNRDVIHLGARLLPYVSLYGGDPALSVSKSPKPDASVYLLHGSDDNVIPSIESEYLANDLRGHAPVRLLLSGLISHADADQPVHVTDVAQLAAFWGDLLAR
jgi:dienelactone hydrolase